MDGFPELRTARLVLDRPTFRDIPAITVYAGNARIAETTLSIPHPYNEDDAESWIKGALEGYEDGTQLVFFIRTKTDMAFIGGIELTINPRFERAEMGYWIAEPYWNRGFATEAVAAVLKYGFGTLGLNKIYATHFLGNPASGRVMTKNGMIREGEWKAHVKKGGTFLSLVQYRLTKNEYGERPRSGAKQKGNNDFWIPKGHR